MPKNMHTSPKTAPGQTPPPDSHNASSHNATACVFDDAICRKNEVHQAKERNILRQGVLGCYCGCRKRSNDDLHRARQGVVSRARTKRLSKARAMQGRAGQGGTGTPFRKKISLPSSTNEDVVDTGGVVFKKHHSTGCLPTCDSQARMRTAGSNIHRAATRSRPYPSRTPPDTRTYSKR